MRLAEESGRFEVSHDVEYDTHTIKRCHKGTGRVLEGVRCYPDGHCIDMTIDLSVSKSMTARVAAEHLGLVNRDGSPKSSPREKAKISSHVYPSGRAILSVQIFPHEERRHYAWRDAPVVLNLVDGSYLFVSCDEEGNAPGTLLVRQDGQSNLLLPPVIEPKVGESTEFRSYFAGESRLVGRSIVNAAPMLLPGWSTRVIVLRLDDGSKVIPMSDPEGNAPGTWFGRDRNGDFVLPNP